jgi:DNA invertase Pin-like site-specific DNA recombinase
MLVPYYRVSTEQQGRSGLGLDAQRTAVREYAERLSEQISAEYTEVESGRSRNRPQLAAAVAMAKACRGQLVVAKLDRLARDAAELLRLIDGIGVVFLDLPDLGHDPITSRLLITVMGAFAEFEARRIGERIRAAWRERKRRGYKPRDSDNFRQPKIQGLGTVAARSVNAEKFRVYLQSVLPIVRDIRSTRTLAQTVAELNSRGILTRRGNPWTVQAVHMILKRGNKLTL